MHLLKRKLFYAGFVLWIALMPLCAFARGRTAVHRQSVVYRRRIVHRKRVVHKRRATHHRRTSHWRRVAVLREPRLPRSIPATHGILHTAYALRFVEMKRGKGPKAAPGDQYVVHYTGWLRNGTKFDSS